MPKITGRLTDFGLDALAEHNPTVVFRHNAPGIAGVSLLTTRPVETVTAYNGYFEAELVASARVSPAGYYTVSIEWEEPPSRKKHREVFPGRLYVPAEGGALADCLRVPANPGLVFTGKEPPANPSPGSWWLDTAGQIQEFGPTGWNFKQNIRGPAGFNATGAAEDDAAIAAFLSRKSKTSAAVDATIAATAGPDAIAMAARPLPTRPAKAQVVFTFDDGWARDMSVVKPILDAAGIKASFCIIASLPGTSPSRLTWEQVHQLEAEGHEIVDHSLTHASLGDTTNQALIKSEIAESHATFLANGLRPTGFCWVGGRSTALARSAARGIYRYALGGTGSRVQPLGTYQMYRETLNHNRDLAQLKRIVDNAKANKEMLVFLTHSTPEELSETGLANLRGVIEYTQSIGVEITTAGKAFEQVGNLLDTEGTVIDGSGRLFEVKGGPVTPGTPAWGGYNLTAATAPQDYAEGAITHSTTTNAANTDWPEKGAGNIVTNRVNGTHYLFAYQEFISQTGQLYYRRGASLTKWGPWATATHNVTAGANTYAADPPANYPKGTTLQPVTGANVPGTPGGVPGLLITHRAGPRFCVQEFQADNGGALHRRTVSAADEWLPWKRLETTA